MKNVLTFILVSAIGLGVGFGAGKAYLYATKKPCGCNDQVKKVQEWPYTADFLKKSV